MSAFALGGAVQTQMTADPCPASGIVAGFHSGDENSLGRAPHRQRGGEIEPGTTRRKYGTARFLNSIPRCRYGLRPRSAAQGSNDASQRPAARIRACRVCRR